MFGAKDSNLTWHKIVQEGYFDYCVKRSSNIPFERKTKNGIDNKTIFLCSRLIRDTQKALWAEKGERKRDRKKRERQKEKRETEREGTNGIEGDHKP